MNTRGGSPSSSSKPSLTEKEELSEVQSEYKLPSGMAQSAASGSATTPDAERSTSTSEKIAATSAVEQDPHTPAPQHDDFQEGGREAWLVVLGGWFGLFCSFGLVTCVGVFLDYYEAHPLANYSPSTVSWITSLQVFVQMGGSAVWGRVYDSYGPRRLLIFGTLTYCFGLMMLSLSTQYYQILLSQAVVSSLGSGAVFTASMTTTTSWFVRKRGTVFGIVNSGSSLGGVVLPIMLSRLFKSVGFGWAIRAMGLMFLALCSVACLLVRPRVAPRPRPLVASEYLRPFREPVMLLTMLGGFLFFWGMFLPLSYIIIQATDGGVPAGLVPYLVPIINAVSLAGRLIVGALADAMGRFNCMMIITAFTGVLTLALWVPGGGSTAAVVTYAVCFGFGSGGYVSIFPACVSQISPQHEIGTRMGLGSLLNAVGALTGSPLGGALISTGPGGRVSFLGLQLFCGATMLASVVAYGAARYLQAGLRWTRV